MGKSRPQLGFLCRELSESGSSIQLSGVDTSRGWNSLPFVGSESVILGDWEYKLVGYLVHHTIWLI